MTLKRRSLLAAVAAAAALSVTSVAPVLAQEAQTTEEQMPEGKILPDIVLGDENAPVTVIEYASFTCSHCQAFHEENFPKLKAEYIDTGKVKFIQRDVYFDAVGLWAGILARCGGDDKYYAVSDMIFDEQKTWLSAKTGEEIAANLRKIGSKVGMSAEQMDACWNDQQKVADLVATFQKNATGDGIEGTPTFIIGGDKVQNQPWDGLKAAIDAKIAAAQ
ncbi:DsbA family protein [Paracoccus sulfuroxidans]|uniref:Protein-disulfide isomerase n=1 Tax=Paracoccus sulfuroxidans TaxID=384678 RepID=A0A562NCU6_9RHOB|nr:DsbA family protein [Paracoccus sulfuroxidans]TWI29947.1 protein-disulfide isomerase [Paracoccus sulfuroxidans]